MLQNIDNLLFIVYTVTLPHSQLISNIKLLSEDIAVFTNARSNFFNIVVTETPLRTLLILNDSQ